MKTTKEQIAKKYADEQFDKYKNKFGCFNSRNMMDAFIAGCELSEQRIAELEAALRKLQLSMIAHPDYVSGKNHEFIDYVSITDELLKSK